MGGPWIPESICNQSINQSTVQWELSCSMWSGGRTDALRNFANAPKKWVHVFFLTSVRNSTK